MDRQKFKIAKLKSDKTFKIAIMPPCTDLGTGNWAQNINIIIHITIIICIILL